MSSFHLAISRSWTRNQANIIGLGRDQFPWDCLFFTWHHIPFLVWMVAPVTSSTDSGPPFNFTSNFCSNITKAIVDSMSANWSPTHFLGPPPKGKKEKSAIILNHVDNANLLEVMYSVSKQLKHISWLLFYFSVYSWRNQANIQTR